MDTEQETDMLVDLHTAIDRLHEAANDLADLMLDVGEDQWTKSRLSSGTEAGHSDPTGDTATDPRRLALREEYIRAQATLTLTLGHVTAATRRLTDAHSRWSGEAHGTGVDT